jgi:hypothetical protein
MSKTGRRAGASVGAVPRLSLLLLLFALFAPVLRAQCNPGKFAPYNPDEHTLWGGNGSGWTWEGSGYPTDCTGYVTVPKGRKFVVLDRMEYATVGWPCYGWVSGDPCSSTFYELTVTAPGGVQVVSPIRVDRSSRDPLPSGGPPWLVDQFGPGFPGLGPLTSNYRRITTVVDVSSYTTGGSIQLALRYHAGNPGDWAMGPGISARFALYGDLFTLTQTPYAFRPRDDRDRAVNGADVAQCGDNPATAAPPSRRA